MPSILDELLWNRASQITGRRPSKWRAPSWSWASIDGEIQTRSYLRPYHGFDVLSMHIELVTPVDPFGEVTSRFIIVKGHIKRACLSRECMRQHHEEGFTQLYSQDLRSFAALRPEYWHHPQDLSSDINLLLDISGPDQEIEVDMAEYVWCLCVADKFCLVLVQEIQSNTEALPEAL